MKELLLEIGCEEMPASWLPSLTQQLGSRLIFHLSESRIAYEGDPFAFSTPRRLGALIRGVAQRQTDLEGTVTGPSVRAAFDSGGKPTPAAYGFAKKQGVRVEQLTRIQTPKGEYLACAHRQRGETSRVALPKVLAAVLRDLSFPKQMHWDAWLDDGYGELVFGRPIRWIVFLHGRQVVPFTILRNSVAQAAVVRQVKSDNITYGHRFFSKSGQPGRSIRVRSFSEYKTRLVSDYVIIDRGARSLRLTRKLEKSAKRVGGKVSLAAQHSSLLGEVPDLVEFPSVMEGKFPSEFLSLPDEVLQTTMIHHQHYFPVEDRKGQLTPYFLAVTNTPRDNVGRIVRNAERVLVARLRDASFFWDTDRESKLQDRLKRLDTLIFHKQLGSYRAKADRVGELAERIAREVFFSDSVASASRLAGTLCKADLTTEMVGEFPELQGIMGGIYAREEGKPEEVWKAMYYHYLPVSIEADASPLRRDLGSAVVSWAAVSLADKLDTLVGLFHSGEKPTGSRDPFGIRRQAQGIIRVLVDLPELTGLSVRVSLGQLLAMAYDQHGRLDDETERRQTTFIRERSRYLLEERGFDIRNVRAVTHQSSLDDLRPLDARRKLEVLPEFVESQDFYQLAKLFKRVKNISRELSDVKFEAAERSSGGDALDKILKEPSERALLNELTSRYEIINSAVETGENFRRAFTEASALGPAVDRFFTEVFVMVEEQNLREARLHLMKRLERLILKLADVSELVPEQETR